MDAKMDSVLPSYMASNPVTATFRDLYRSFSKRREALGLPNPGRVDDIAKEVQKDVFLTNQMFTGLRADFTRPLSLSPFFQFSHTFAMGSVLPPYGFMALFGTEKCFLQSTLENDGQVVAKFNYRWNDMFTTKATTQIASGQGQGMLQLDTDITGQDFTANIKSINPSYLEGGLTGMFIGSYLQSLTPSLAVGLEAIWQRPALNASPEAALSYCARYKTADWIASAQLQAQGAVNTSYWRRLTDKAEAGVDLNLQFQPGLGGSLLGAGAQKEGTATLGAKYDFRMSTFRAQLDSNGKVSCLLDKRLLPMINLTIAGEMDHYKQQAKLGVSVSIEAAPEDVTETAGPSSGPLQVPF